MEAMYLSELEREALKSIYLRQLEKQIDQAIWDERATELRATELASCGEYVREALRRFERDLGEYAKSKAAKKRAETQSRARRVSVFSSLPTEPDPALHVHNLSFIEYLLQIAGAARQWGGDDVLEEVRKRLLKWSIAVSLHQWDALENGIYALAAIAVAQGKGEPDRLLRDLQASVSEAWVGKDTRDHVARELRAKAENLRERQFEINVIEKALTSVDREPIKALLRNAANILSPDTRNEPVRSPIF